jgi:hypothetical protein
MARQQLHRAERPIVTVLLASLREREALAVSKRKIDEEIERLRAEQAREEQASSKKRCRSRTPAAAVSLHADSVELQQQAQ